MNRIRHCSYMLRIIIISLGLLMITSCGKQGVISANSDSDSETKEVPKEVYITLEGGSGKATIHSPAKVEYDDKYHITLVWNSKNYDYMKVGDTTYYNENEGGESTFTITVDDISGPLNIIADTVAMSKPHEIEYTLYFDTEEAVEEDGIEAPKIEVTDSIDIGIKGVEQELTYATQFRIIKYEEYSLIVVNNDSSYLLVPEGKPVPDVPDDVIILKQPLDRTYLVSSSVMDLIRQCGAVDYVAMTGTKQSDWKIKEAADAMEQGKIVYAGKYNAPDYELILQNGCNLAIENTMIYHKPDVKEKLEELGIPVLVEKSSYEPHPMGRLEWIKLYGTLYGREAEAESFFDGEVEAFNRFTGYETDNKVAFFYITTGGMVNARMSNDYIAKMIELAGGKYCLNAQKETDSTVATLNMQMEDFYVNAKDADVLIYNSTIGGEIKTVDELIDKNELFKDFKAVKEGKVYCTGKDFFQETTGVVTFMKDLKIIYSNNGEDLTYLYRLE